VFALTALAERKAWQDLVTAYGAFPDYAREDATALRLYARALVQLDRREDALAMLERAATLHPGDDRLLTELGVLRLAAGDVAGARRAMARASRSEMLSPAERAGVERYLDAIETVQSTRWRFTLAAAPDSNPALATEAETIGFFGLPLQLSDSARAQSVLGVDYGAQVEVRRPVSALDATFWRAEVRLDGLEYEMRRFDQVSAGVQVGPRWVRARSAALFGVDALLRQRWAAGDAFRTEAGLASAIAWRVSDDWRLDGQLQVYWAEHATVDRRDGVTGALGATATRSIEPDRFERLGLAFQRTEADAAFERFSYARLSGAVYRTVLEDVGVLGEVWTAWRRHDAGTLVFALREDVELGGQIRLSYAGWEWQGLSPYVGVEASLRESDHPLFDDTRRLRGQFGIFRAF